MRTQLYRQWRRLRRTKLRKLARPLLIGALGLLVPAALWAARPTHRTEVVHGGPSKVAARTPAPTQAVLGQAATPSPTPASKPGTKATPKPPAKSTPKPAAPAAPTSEIASEAQCPGQSNPAAAATVLACMANVARVYHGLGGIGGQSQLLAAASAKMNDMITCGYSHTACNREADYWVKNKGYGGLCSGENIAYGQTTPRQVFIAWMNSPGHRANILQANYRHIGSATGVSSLGRLWVMELGGCS